jgi:hypothetical protein
MVGWSEVNTMVVMSESLPPAMWVPDPKRLPADPQARAATVAAHERALECGDDGYFDPETSLFVMSAAYLWARGECCDTGCRHCPFWGLPE